MQTALENKVDLASEQTITGTKTITSNLNLSPSSSSSNTGGQINFHYNQSANTTSSIVENASGQVRIDGNLYLNGDIVNTITSTSSVPIRIYNMDSSSQDVQREIVAFEDRGSSSSKTVGQVLFHSTQNSREHSLRLRAYNAGTYADIVVGVRDDGSKYTTTYTPATDDNSSKIATTAFVNNRLPYTSGTWTPVLAGSETAGAFTYNVCRGFYIKIGHLVYIWARLNPTYTTHPVGTAFIRGLPYTPDVKAGGIRYEGNAYATGGVNNCFRHISGCTIITDNSQILLNMNQLESSARYYKATFNTTAATSGTILSFSSSSSSCDIYISCVYATAS